MKKTIQNIQQETNTSILKPNTWIKKQQRLRGRQFVKWETYLEKYLECRTERQTENLKEKMSRLNDLRNIYLEFQKEVIEWENGSPEKLIAENFLELMK